ncbi:MAG TPA: DUF4115 domain-containing protein [Acidimicrobiales bacterium]
MATIVVLGVIALVAAIVAWVTWQRGADERQSVQHHQHTLETLRHVADRDPPSVWPGQSRRSTSKNRPTLRPPGGTPKETSKAQAPATTHVRSPLPGAAVRARRGARARVRRARTVAVAAVIVVGGVVGGALALGRSHVPARASSPPTVPSRPITAAGRGLPTTTVLTRVVVPSSPTAFSARYAAPSTTYAVAISASAMCWVMATDPSSGHVVWTGTIAAGASRSLSVSGSLAVELGAPSDASVTMDGRAVQLPTGFRSPFTLTFQRAP